jgi:predicted DNA-binding protein (MmcQ/YjbR family)
MSREAINKICAAFPGAEVSDPWGGGHDAWKVGGKMFATIVAVTPGVSVKTDGIETAEMLIETGVGVKAPYFHRSWVLLPFDTPEGELRHRLAESYRLVRRRLTKKVQATLEPFD